ncbi:hypothetical protein RFI_09951, partial [Reticulomyxa filosa]
MTNKSGRYMNILFTLLFSFSICVAAKSLNASAQHVLVIGVDGLGGMYLENATSFLPNFNQVSFYPQTKKNTYAHGLVYVFLARKIDKMNQNGTFFFVPKERYPKKFVHKHLQKKIFFLCTCPMKFNSLKKNTCTSRLVSAPNWCAIITGLTPPQSGVVSNSWVPADDNPANATELALPPINGAGQLPQTMWDVAKQATDKIVIAASVSWDWIGYLFSNDVDYSFLGNDNDTAVALTMSDFIVSFKPDLIFLSQVYFLFFYFFIFLSFKWNLYDNAMYVPILWLLSEIADHGGWGNTHGQFNECNMYIPVIFSGPGIIKNNSLTNYVENVDLAPTVLNSLGIKLEPKGFEFR